MPSMTLKKSPSLAREQEMVRSFSDTVSIAKPHDNRHLGAFPFLYQWSILRHINGDDGVGS